MDEWKTSSSPPELTGASTRQNLEKDIDIDSDAFLQEVNGHTPSLSGRKLGIAIASIAGTGFALYG